MSFDQDPRGGKMGLKLSQPSLAHRFTIPWHLAQDTVLLVGSSWQQQEIWTGQWQHCGGEAEHDGHACHVGGLGPGG